MNASPLETALRLAGGVTAVAKAFGISQPAIHRWRARGKPPADRVLDLERATGGQVTRHQLRPDVFGERSTVPHNRRASDQLTEHAA